MECEPPEGAPKPKTRIPLRFEENAAGIILALLALITFTNVVVRYLTNFSFAFTEEFSIILMVVMTLFGSSSLMAKGGHLNIAFIVDRLPATLRRRVKLGAHAVTAFTFLILTILSARMAWDEYRYEVTSPGLGVPTWLYTIWLPLLFMAVTGRAVGVTMRFWREED